MAGGDLTFLSIVYLVLAVFLFAMLFWTQSRLKFRQKRGMTHLFIGVVLTAAALWGLLAVSQSLEAKAGSILILSACLTYTLWQKGLSDWGVIGSLRQIKPYHLLTAVSITTTKKQQTLLRLQFGTMQVVRLTLGNEPQTIHAFLQTHHVAHINIS